jgi:hypothetical protein
MTWFRVLDYPALPCVCHMSIVISWNVDRVNPCDIEAALHHGHAGDYYLVPGTK